MTTDKTKYTEVMPDYGDLIPIDEWREHVRVGMFIPYDGIGHYARDGNLDPKSNVWRTQPPADATHVAWFNR